MNPANQLFQQLLQAHQLISYSHAYQILVGNRVGPWRNKIHVPQVLAAAAHAIPQIYQGLTIQLDALIVNQGGTQEPSDGHFHAHNYTRQQWQAVFGGWPVI